MSLPTRFHKNSAWVFSVFVFPFPVLQFVTQTISIRSRNSDWQRRYYYGSDRSKGTWNLKKVFINVPWIVCFSPRGAYTIWPKPKNMGGKQLWIKNFIHFYSNYLLYTITTVASLSLIFTGVFSIRRKGSWSSMVPERRIVKVLLLGASNVSYACVHT